MDFPLFAFVPFSAAALAFLLRLFFALLLKACPFAPLGESNSKLFRLFAMVVVYLRAPSPICFVSQGGLPSNLAL